ncbi:MAG: hypothetical protein ABI925_08760 [Verrucomicrobiota bacterium]
MLSRFRTECYTGFGVALIVGLVLSWIWQPERQVRRHTEALFQAIERGNWDDLSSFIASDYRDQWGHNRARVMERIRAFGYLGEVRINSPRSSVQIDHRRGKWTGKIAIEPNHGEVAIFIKEHINSATIPFELEWHRLSIKPWDWKLVRVSNSDLDIPNGGY